MANTRWADQGIRKWIEGHTWYQRIQLSNGLETPDTVDSKQRLTFLKGEQIADRTVLDIGCNSGYYRLWAKKQGAARVVGVDIDEHRLEQARTLPEVSRGIAAYRVSVDPCRPGAGFQVRGTHTKGSGETLQSCISKQSPSRRATHYLPRRVYSSTPV